MKHNTKLAIKQKKERLLEVLLEVDNESVDEICKKAGISRQTYYTYAKDPQFSQLLNQTTASACTMRQNFVVKALLKQAEGGNVQAIRTVLEMNGHINVGKGNQVNIYQEQPKADTSTYKDSQEALEEIAKRRAELDRIEQTIRARLKGDGIHPQAEHGTTGKA